MKMKIKQTLRSMWALVLAVLMLLSTFSAVAVTLNVESTGSITGNIYFDNTKTQYSSVYAFIGHGSYIKSYKMSLDSDNIWKTETSFNNEWNDATNIYFASSDGGVSGGTGSYNMDTPRSDLGLTSYTNKSTTVSAGTSSCYVPDTSDVNTALSIMTVDEAKASHSGSSGDTSSYTFKSGTTIYYDFTACSSLSPKAVNYNTGNSNNLAYDPNGAGKLIPVQLTNDLTFSSDGTDTIVKTEHGGWNNDVLKNNIVPTDGQDMIIVAADGKSYTWGTYGSSSTETSTSTTSPSTANWYLAGSFYGGNWSDTKQEFIDGSKTVDLTAGTPYEFKLVKDSTWYGNNDPITDSVTDKEFTTNGGNCKITPSVTGTYTFTINTTNANPKLSVTYPQAVTTYDVTLDSNITGGSISTEDQYTGLSGTNYIHLTANPNAGYTFTGWSATSGESNVTFSPQEATTTATVKGACTITATFAENSTPDVASGVTLAASPTDVIVNNPVTLTATLDTPNENAANVIYTFNQTSGSTVTLSSNGTASNKTTFTPTEAGTYKFTVTASCAGYNDVQSSEITVTVTAPVDVKGNAFSEGMWIDAQPGVADSADAMVKPYFGTSGKVKFYLPGSVDLTQVHFYHKYNSLTVEGVKDPITSGNTYDISSWSGKTITYDGISKTLQIFKSTAKSLYINKTYTTDSNGNKTYQDMPTSKVTDGTSASAFKKKCNFSGTYVALTKDGTTINSYKKLKSIKGRGNSSWQASCEIFGKYAYNISLGEKADLAPGGTPSKKWSMLANNADEAMMRNILVYNLADAIGLEDSPMSDVYDVYNNGTYLGSYQMSEKVEVGSGLLVPGTNVDKLNEDKNTTTNQDGTKTVSAAYDTDTQTASNGNLKDNSTKGYYKYCAFKEGFVEPSADEYKAGNYLLEFELDERFPDETSGFISNYGQQVVLKSPEYASRNEVLYAMDRFNFAEAVIYYLASGSTNPSVTLPAGTLTVNSGNYSYTGKDSGNTYSTKNLDLGQLIDVENFAKAYLIQEFTENLDGVATSFYVDITGVNDVLVSKPVWDFDWTMGQYNKAKAIGGNQADRNPSLTNQWFIKDKYIYSKSNPNGTNKNIMATLCSIESFWAKVKEVWNGTSNASLLSTGSSSLFPVSALMGKKASLNPVGATSGTTGVYETITGLYGDSGLIKGDYTTALSSSVAMNEDRYGFIASDPLIPDNWGSNDTGDTWTDAVNYLDTWANKRATWMNARLNDVPEEKNYLYFKDEGNYNTDGSTIHAHIYNYSNKESAAGWPGIAMVLIDPENKIYRVEYTDNNYTNVIFSKSGNNKIGNDNDPITQFGTNNMLVYRSSSDYEWTTYTPTVASYYIGGRFYTGTAQTGDANNDWDMDSKKIPFEYNSEKDLYYVTTNKTVAELYGASDKEYYFVVHNGSDKAYVPENNALTFQDNIETNKLQLVDGKYNDSNTTKMLFSGSDTTGKVTLWFDANNKQIWYTTDAVGAYTITKADATNGSFTVSQATANQGDNITITASPSNGFVVDTVTVTGASGTVDVTGTGNTRTFTMPAENVTVSVTFREASKYTVTFDSSDDSMGTVTSENCTSGTQYYEGTKLTVTATPLEGYMFVGWYSDAQLNTQVSTDATYNFTVTGTTTLYAKFSEAKGDKVNWAKALFSNQTNNPSAWNESDCYDVYKVAEGSPYATAGYTLMFDINVTDITADREFYFALSGSTNHTDIYWKNSTTVTVSASTEDILNLLDTKEGTSTQNYNVNGEGNYNFGKLKVSSQNKPSLTGVTVYVDTSGDGEGRYLIVANGVTKPEGTVTIYAKNGTLKTTYEYGTTTVTGISKECEVYTSLGDQYSTYCALKDDRIVAQTEVKATYAKYGWYVYAYVINGVSYPATKVVDTSSTYQMDTPYIVQEGQNVEITPIYLNTNIEKENGYVTLYVDPNDLGDHWGNTISVYSYYYVGTSTDGAKQMNSAYPGEPMMLESTGLYKAFIPKDAWEVNANGVFEKVANCPVSGLTLNNYTENETIHQGFLTEEQNHNYQTYDYDDFKVIAAAGYDTVKYDIKYRITTTNPTNQSTLLNNVNDHPVKTDAITPSDYADEWEDLTDIDGNLASIVGFTSNSVPSGAKFDTAEKNKLYIVSTGNQNVSGMGQFATMWYVYDHSGNYITQGLPSDFIPRYTSEGQISDSQTTAYNAIVNGNYAYTSALIAYESEQNASTSSDTGNSGTRLDGRWYYARSAEELTVTTHVLYANKESDKSWTEDTYNPNFTGVTTGALATVDDIRTTKVTRNTSVTISASPSALGSSNTTYKFIGWATDVVVDKDGKFTPTKSTTLVDSTSIFSVASNTDAYALYVPVGKGDLVINHSAYSKVNPNANGGTGRYFVQAVVTHSDGKTDTYYAQNGVTVPITSEDENIDVTLYTISTNGCTYVGTYVYNGLTKEYNDITISGSGKSYVGKVNPASAPATVTHSIEVSKIFGEDKSQKLSSTLDYYSDLKTNTITVKLNYYDRKVAGGTPVDINSEATTYSYKPTSYPAYVYDDKSGEVVLSKLINYAVSNSVKPDNLLDTYYYWTSQADAVTEMQTIKNYHENRNYLENEVTHHTNQYGEPQQSGEKWVTYYGKDDKGKVVEIEEANATANNVSTISIWYFNTPKKYSYTMNLAKTAADLTSNSDGTYYSNGSNVNNVVKSGVGDNKPLFFNQRLGGAGGTEVENSAPNYLQKYGITQGYVETTTETARTIDVEEAGTTKTLKFIGWATDTAGKNIVSTNYKYGLRITGNVKVYAIYGEKELDHPGVNIQGIKPEQYFDQNNVSKTRISTMFTAYNCPDSDENIENIGIVYLKVTTTETKNALDALMESENAEKLKKLRKNIAQVVSKADYAFFKSGTVDSVASDVILEISGTTASGFKYKVVNPNNNTDNTIPTGFKASLTNKNRGQFTHIFTTSVIKNYTYYAFATMGYKNYPAKSIDTSVYKDESGITYITSDNFAKFAFNSNGECVTKFE